MITIWAYTVRWILNENPRFPMCVCLCWLNTVDLYCCLCWPRFLREYTIMYTVCLNEYVISLLQCVYITSSQKCVCVDKMLCLDVTSLACAFSHWYLSVHSPLPNSEWLYCWGMCPDLYLCVSLEKLRDQCERVEWSWKSNKGKTWWHIKWDKRQI